jgi:hypothetical protein
MNFNLVQRDGLIYYRFPLLEQYPEIVHGVLGRQGGVSHPPFDSLNLSFSVGDQIERVRTNRRLVRETLGVEEMVSVGQVHGNNVLILTTREYQAAGAEVQGIDILITNLPGLGLLIKQADCQAVLLYDPDVKAIANIHCGWRGNVQNILGQAVAQLRAVFNSRPERLLAAISPSLGPCCAEFVNYRVEWPESFWPFQAKPTYFDLWEISRHQLETAGVQPKNIQIAGLCTRCHESEFFSYRRDKITGRGATVIALAEKIR